MTPRAQNILPPLPPPAPVSVSVPTMPRARRGRPPINGGIGHTALMRQNKIIRAARDSADLGPAPVAQWGHDYYAALRVVLKISHDDVCSRRKSPSLVALRRCVWLGLRLWPGPLGSSLTWNEIARITGHSNHTVPMDGCRRLTEAEKAYTARVVAGLRGEAGR